MNPQYLVLEKTLKLPMVHVLHRYASPNFQLLIYNKHHRASGMLLVV